MFASPSRNPALSAKITSSTGLQEGGCCQKAGPGCMSGSLRAFSAAANSEGARKALPSMEREEWCSECAVKEGSRYTNTPMEISHRAWLYQRWLETALHVMFTVHSAPFINIFKLSYIKKIKYIYLVYMDFFSHYFWLLFLFFLYMHIFCGKCN